MHLLLVATSALVVLCSAQDSYSRMAFPNKPGLALFDQAKLGLFVHWGPVSQWGTEISFPLTCGSFPCDVRGPNNTARVLHNAEELAAHRAEYAALAHTWNPVLFNATDLAELAYTAGFRYLTHVAEHCDGFSQWNASQNRAYSVMTSPFGRDIVGEMMAAFRARGLRAGVYFCPSTWNSNLYWWPNASTALGTCCSPNYDPLAGDAEGARWEAYLSYLHGQVTELTEGYAPDHYWFDSGTTPPAIDTRLEQLVPAMRARNPEVVVHVRDGGSWHDYVEPNDHSEGVVDAILGLSYARAGDKFEVPGTLGQQWAYDPAATYKDAATVIKDLIGIVSKGGNYLLNIGLDSTGVWAPQALATLANMSAWFAYAGESIHGTAPTWPYSWGPGYSPDPTQWFTASPTATYVFFFQPPPNGTLLVPDYKPATLAAPPAAVRRLTPSGPLTLHFALLPSGLAVQVGALPGALLPLRTLFKAYSAHSVDNAPCGARDCSVYTGAGYSAAGVEGGCLTPAGAAAAGEATVPLTLFFNGLADNVAALAAPGDGQAWQAVDSECAAFAGQGQAGDRWPLELWHSAALGDWWTLASPQSRAKAQAGGYVRNATIGYLASEVPPPSVESYAYVLRIEW